MIRVVTTFSRKQWDDYVNVLLPRSIELWPKEVQWQVWLDSRDCGVYMHTSLEPPGFKYRPEIRYLSDDPEHELFMQKWNDRVRRNPALKHEITVKRYPTGYTLDAGTFAHKVFAFTSKEARDGAEWLIFLGSDVETLRAVDMEWLGSVLAGDISHLGRRDIRSSETDWLAIKVKPGREPCDCEAYDRDLPHWGDHFLNALRHVYTSGDIYHYGEWIDGFVTARLVEVFKGMGADISNLSEGIPGLDVFEKSVLGQRLRHHKGPGGKKALMGLVKA